MPPGYTEFSFATAPSGPRVLLIGDPFADPEYRGMVAVACRCGWERRLCHCHCWKWQLDAFIVETSWNGRPE